MARTDSAGERQPLLEREGTGPQQDWSEPWQWTSGYSLKSHATMEDGGQVVDYDPDKLSTMRVFAALSGTVLSDPILFTEQLILTVIFGHIIHHCPLLLQFGAVEKRALSG